MGRPAHRQSLSLWANGVRVGSWRIPARGQMELQYDDAWVAAPVGRPLSLSLPFTLNNRPLKGQRIYHYFDNLLPDNDGIRKRVAERFGTGSIEPFALLKAIGRDCVGAVQILGEDETPTDITRVDGTPLDEEAVERHLLNTIAPRGFAGTSGVDADLRISLAGAQEKTALLWWNGQWHMPHGATPTTHIFKLPLGLVGGRQADFSASVDNEWLCLKLLQAYGLPVADAHIATFGKQRVLVVERFDRQLAPDGRWLMRLPQEDFCQALGCSPLRKYENEGGPGLKALFAVLRQSVHAESDMATLMTAQILFWMLRAPDGHAKNFSIRLLPQGRFHLTRLYDVMSAWPIQGDGPHQWHPKDVRLAMALLGKNRHYRMMNVQRRHFDSTARHVGCTAPVEPIIEAILARTPGVVEQVRASLPADFSAQVAQTVLDGLQHAAQTLARRH